jgi:hypothetical protein
MSVTLATVADALIEFILSLLRDPEAALEFDEDPEAALAARGLSNVSAFDVCSVAPVVAERTGVVAASTAAPVPAPRPAPEPDPVDPVVREIQTIMNSLTYVDNHNTIVDQSVNQNIWANGDVTQHFDQEAIVASGEDSIAAGDDVTQETDLDNSTDITAGDDVLVGSENAETTNEDSNNTSTETETTTDASTDTTVTESGNTTTDTTTVDESFDDTTVEYTEQNVDSDSTAVFDSTDVTVEDTTPDDDF